MMQTTINHRRNRLSWIVSWPGTATRKGGERKFSTKEAALAYMAGPRVSARGAILEYLDRAGWRSPVPKAEPEVRIVTSAELAAADAWTIEAVDDLRRRQGGA